MVSFNAYKSPPRCAVGISILRGKFGLERGTGCVLAWELWVCERWNLKCPFLCLLQVRFQPAGAPQASFLSTPRLREMHVKLL